MFKSARWRNEKNRVKAVFKFQFHVTQVPLVGWESMVVSLVPLDIGKASLKSDRAAVVDGECQWVKPVFETARLVQDPKTMKFNEKIYQFLVSSAGSTKAGVLGETSINLADYAQVFKPYSVSLPLKGSNNGSILHVTVQRIEGEDVERRRDTEENGDTIVKQPRKTLQSQLSNGENDGTSSAKENLFTNGELRKSSSFESASNSDSSSGQYTPKGNGIGNGISLSPLNPINSLAEALVRATMELESTRAAAQEQLRRLESQTLHLSSLLHTTTRERDEARSLLLLLLNNPQHQPLLPTGDDDASTSKPDLDPDPDLDDEEEGSNNVGGASPPPPPPVSTTMAAEAELEAAAEKRGLPEKGRLLEAVVRAGPLLQTLLLAGPLPQWRHPPPALQSFEIPPVSICLSSPESNGSGRKKFHKKDPSSFHLS